VCAGKGWGREREVLDDMVLAIADGIVICPTELALWSCLERSERGKSAHKAIETSMWKFLHGMGPV
jgi:hypothetical protein